MRETPTKDSKKVQQKKRKINKVCFVPRCKSSTVNSPDKLFFPVPVAPLRKEWFTKVRRKQLKLPKSKVYCCEDHFDVENDVEDWMRFRILKEMGRPTFLLRIKQGVLPHKFECQSNCIMEYESNLDNVIKTEEIQNKKIKEEIQEEEILTGIQTKQIKEEIQEDKGEVEILIEIHNNKIKEEQEEELLPEIQNKKIKEEIEEGEISGIKIKKRKETFQAEETETDIQKESENNSYQLETKKETEEDRDSAVPINEDFKTSSVVISAVSNLAIVYIDDSTIPGTKRGAWTKTAIKANTIFGFYDKETIVDDDEDGGKQVINRTLNSDWTTYFNVAKHCEANLVAFPYRGCVFYLAQKTILPRTEILVDYSLHENKQEQDATQWHGENEHLNNLGFTCGVCNISFPSFLFVLKHVRFCNRTNSIYATVRNEESELLSKFKFCVDLVQNFQCDKCNVNFYQRDILVKHMAKHSQKKSHECGECGKSFTQRSNLRRHVRSHTGEKAFQCTLCDKRFTSKRGMLNHLRTHTRKKPYKCEDCRQSFNLLNTLKKHYTNKHTREKLFKCDECGAAFSQPTTLKNHKLVHTGAKPFKCNQCDRCFALLSDLKRHIRGCHNNDRPFQCYQCKAFFKSKKDLGQHIMLHTGQKPFSCKVCGATFARIGTLNRHNRRHTGERPYRCDACGCSFTRRYFLNNHPCR